MKRIIQKCQQEINSYDQIKLRLRGRGSGYREGPDKQGLFFSKRPTMDLLES